jgi:hypothetical protein
VDSKVFDPQFSRPFLHRAELLRDSLTDSSFWFCGPLLAITAILAGLKGSHASSHAFAWFAIATGLTVWHGIAHYKPQKLRFDRSGIPYFVRLAKLNAHFLAAADDEDPSDTAKYAARDAISDFLDPDKPCHVMILAGSDDSGKTTLACGIATEFAVWPKHKHPPTTRYILMGELYSMVRRQRGRYDSSGVVSDSRPLSAAAADILIIDEAELTPDRLEALDREAEPNLTQTASKVSSDHHVSVADGLKFLLLGKKRIVLVVHQNRVEAWKVWLEDCLHSTTPVPTIWLKDIIDDDSVQPSRPAKILSVALFITLTFLAVWWLCALLYTAHTP